MKKRLTTFVSIAVLLALLVSLAAGISVQAKPTSPEVGPDGWVTFNYRDPHATLVQLYIEAGRNELGAMCYGPEGWPVYDMTKENGSLWSYTLQLDPNFYNYHFVVDGEAVSDPLNPAWHPDVR